MSTIPSSPSLLPAHASNMQPALFLPNIVLDETNYPTWLFRMESFLKSLQLYEYVDGTSICPSQFILGDDGVTTKINPSYLSWKAQDQSIVNVLAQTLSPIAMSCAGGSKTAAQMWSNLKLKFASPNRQNILQLKSNLQELKKGNDSIDTYLDRFKAARDALATVGVFLEDEDVVVSVLRGLPPSFAAIKTVIRSQYQSCSMHELRTLLKAAEVDIEQETTGTSLLPLTAMVAHNNNGFEMTNQSNVSDRKMPLASSTMSTSPTTSSVTIQKPFISLPTQSTYHFPPSSSSYTSGIPDTSALFSTSNFKSNNKNSFSSSIICQLCNQQGHVAKNCYKLQLFSKQGSGNSSQPPIECQYCGRKYHTADKCFHLIGFPPNFRQKSSYNIGAVNTGMSLNQGSIVSPSSSSSQVLQTPPMQSTTATTENAMFVASQPTSQIWFADSGASQHMTNEVSLLSDIVNYPSSDIVTIGNGEKLRITKTGQSAGQDIVQRTE